MIKITHILKESFVTYLHNFKKIFWIALPILILGIISEYYAAVFTIMLNNNDFSNMPYFIGSVLVYLVTILVASLFFAPVLNRAIQKKEDDGNFDSKQAYDFQKKNIFKWIMVNVWGMLYMLWIMLPYIVVAALLTAVLFMYKDSGITALILSSVIGLVFLVGIIMNISKFILYKNIFFSKDEVSARDAVRESIMFGKTKNGQVWMLILILIILTIIMLIVYFILGFLMGLIYKSAPESILYIEIITSAVVSTIIFLPLMSIVVAKGYVKIRG